MNKDTVVASIIGLTLGLIAAVAIWVVPRILPNNNQKPTTTTQASQSPSLTSDALSLEIISNKDGDIVKTKTLKITGKTTNALLVTITTPSQNQIVKPTINGEYETEIDLSIGGNQIVVSAIDTKNQDVTKNLIVYYFEDKI